MSSIIQLKFSVPQADVTLWQQMLMSYSTWKPKLVIHTGMKVFTRNVFSPCPLVRTRAENVTCKHAVEIISNRQRV